MTNYRHSPPSWPVPLREFTARRDAFRRWNRRSGVIAAFLVVAGLVGFVVLMHWLVQIVGVSDAVEITVCFGFAGVLCAVCVLLPRWLNRLPAQFGLRCPQCGVVMGNLLIATTIATRHCGECGARLIAE